MVTKKALYAEFMGTFALLFAGTGAIAAGKADLLGVALAHGIAIAVAVSAFAGIFIAKPDGKMNGEDPGTQAPINSAASVPTPPKPGYPGFGSC